MMKDFKVKVTTFEHLCNYVTVENRHLVILFILSSRLRDADIRFFSTNLVKFSMCYSPINVQSFCSEISTSTLTMHLMQMVGNFYAFYIPLYTINMLVNQLTQHVTHWAWSSLEMTNQFPACRLKLNFSTIHWCHSL